MNWSGLSLLAAVALTACTPAPDGDRANPRSAEVVSACLNSIESGRFAEAELTGSGFRRNAFGNVLVGFASGNIIVDYPVGDGACAVLYSGGAPAYQAYLPGITRALLNEGYSLQNTVGPRRQIYSNGQNTVELRASDGRATGAFSVRFEFRGL